MGKNMSDYEHDADNLDWNRRIKRKMNQYFQATGEEKREYGENIVKYMEDKYWYGYDIDGILLENEHIGMIQKMDEILTGKKKPTYEALQADWNKELAEVLEQGEIIRILELAKIGKRLAFIREPGSNHVEYYNRIRQMVSSIEQTLDKGER